MSVPVSKLDYDGEWVDVSVETVRETLETIYIGLGCDSNEAALVTDHLIDSSLCGVDSHGVMRTLQYAEQFQSGNLIPSARPRTEFSSGSLEIIDGQGGLGIQSMVLAYEHGMVRATETGICATAVRNVGHTGRLGAYADDAATRGFLTICMGGGNRCKWPQAAPYGGSKGVLPTNPWCIGIPGGLQGPVVVDFATAKIAGGWIYAAHSAGARLPEGCVIDRDGNPTVDPKDYFNGGAILPAGGHKGYGLALIAELVAEALVGPAKAECNWMVLVLDTKQLQSKSHMETIAEEILAELRECPPAPGFDKVEIPGERERLQRTRYGEKLILPTPTWQQIQALQLQVQKTVGEK